MARYSSWNAVIFLQIISLFSLTFRYICILFFGYWWFHDWVVDWALDAILWDIASSYCNSTRWCIPKAVLPRFVGMCCCSATYSRIPLSASRIQGKNLIIVFWMDCICTILWLWLDLNALSMLYSWSMPFFWTIKSFLCVTLLLPGLIKFYWIIFLLVSRSYSYGITLVFSM